MDALIRSIGELTHSPFACILLLYCHLMNGASVYQTVEIYLDICTLSSPGRGNQDVLRQGFEKKRKQEPPCSEPE
ncbi:hypothetical protein B0T10DRAFT_491199 [Thelonectria olida]|uniref:Uncharacterized protein n=1 Tax=Thelonectria olida TaxID=1576542 RepID=A0A9P8W1G7_9HYPO|nr:hypothetical protein B0T10DRAFT_491199 [Thelonectria olida]